MPKLTEREYELLAVLEDEAILMVSYVRWRREAGLLPTAADCLRLRRWTRQAERWGVLLPFEALP